MAALNEKTIRSLAKTGQGTRVSLHMPTHRNYSQTSEDKTRLKNLLNEARERLRGNNLSTEEIAKILGPAEKLADDIDFWKNLGDGLILLMDGDQMYVFRVPVLLEPFVLVSEDFYLRHLIRLLTEDREIYLLEISQNSVRFFRATRSTITNLKLPETVGSITEALRLDEPEKQLQFRTGTPSSRGNRHALFHGHGLGNDNQKNKISRFFKDVDKALQEYLKGNKDPLVLACVDYLVPIYSRVNSYCCLMEEHISGNPEGVSEDSLRQKAWKIVSRLVSEEKRNAISRYQDLIGAGLGSDAYKDIVPAAYEGRVDTLITAIDKQIWVHHNPKQAVISLSKGSFPAQGEMINNTVIQTFLHDGKIYEVDSRSLPESKTMVAIYRY